jgi:hypothetical protein
LKARLRGVITGIGERGYVAVPGDIGTALGVIGIMLGDLRIMSSYAFMVSFSSRCSSRSARSSFVMKQFWAAMASSTV